MSERVLVLSPRGGDATGLTAAGRELAGAAGSVAALILGTETPTVRPPGVSRVYAVTVPGFDADRGDHVGAAVVAAVRGFDASIVLAGPTKLDGEALARAGAALDAPTVTGVRSPRPAADGVEVTRDILSGNATATELIPGRPVLLTLTRGPPPSPPSEGPFVGTEVVPLHVELPSYPFRRLSVTPKSAGGANLEAADRIVSVGRGLQKKEDLSLVNGLAAVLGAAVGCTRPLAAESGWLSDDHWVGLTGHRVHPTLYIAIGISGAVQHLVGMRDSKLVVAINKDANAPIFQQADFQVVGDLYAIVPELTRRLAAATTASS